RAALPQLASVHARLAHYRIREACGLEPVPHAPKIVEWLQAHTSEFASVVGQDLRAPSVVGLDLSVGSPLVSSDPIENAAEPFGRRVFKAMQEAGAEIGAGGYGEARLIYAADAYGAATVMEERRAIHIGIDLTLAAGSPVCAPLAGVVHG